jgi:Tfp pilus assembly protein PilN
VQQIQVRIDEAKNAYMAGGATNGGLGLLDLLAEISARIPPALQVQIVKLTADQSDVRLRGTTETFNIVDSIQKELEKSPYFSKVEISSANSSVKSGTIDFEIKLVLRQ